MDPLCYLSVFDSTALSKLRSTVSFFLCFHHQIMPGSQMKFGQQTTYPVVTILQKTQAKHSLETFHEVKMHPIRTVINTGKLNTSSPTYPPPPHPNAFCTRPFAHSHIYWFAVHYKIVMVYANNHTYKSMYKLQKKKNIVNGY